MRKPLVKNVAASKWNRALIQDLSIGGMRLTAPLSVEPNTDIAVLFTLPSAFLREFDVEKPMQETGTFGVRTVMVQVREPDFKEMELYGKVVGRALNREQKIFHYHIKFVGLTAATEEELNRFVILTQRYQLKHRRHIV